MTLSQAVDPARTLAKIGDIAASAGLRRIHILAWRDLSDVEAGGSELHAATIAKLWAEAGIEVVMRTSYAQGHPPAERRDGYQVYRRAGRYLVFPRAALSEMTGRHGQRDGLVEIWNGMPFFTPLWARGPRVVFLHHVHAEMWRLALPPKLARMGDVMERRVAPPLYRRSRVITLSQSSRHELLSQLGLRPEQVSVVPPGIDARFRPGGDKSARPLVVAVGRLMPAKRFDVLIRAVAEARRRHGDLELVIVGDGYERNELETLVRDLDAGEWVTLAGKVSDDALVELYQRAWVLASASVREGWGMTITEAAACATPAVATRIAGHTDAVVDGVTGLLADTPRQLTQQLERVLSDDGLRRQLGQAALGHAANFTWEATAAGTLSALALEAVKKGFGRLR